MRYTKLSGGKWIVPKNVWSEAAKELAAYENTGLTPEKICEIDDLYQEKCRELQRIKAEHDHQKAELLIRIDYIDGQLLDDPVSEIRKKVEEVLA